LIFGPSHVDVVPVPNAGEWEVDPFSGIIKDGFIWGRGTLDMLFIVATQVVAFAKLHEEEFKPVGDLMLLIVADEETGGSAGIEWMLLNHPDLFHENYFCVTESGGISISPGKLVLVIGEKGGNWKRLKFKGTPGHGSTPFAADNAVLKASTAAIRLIDYCDNKIPLSTEYLSYIAKGLDLGFFQRLMLTNKRLLPVALKKMAKSNPSMGKIIHSLSRMTMSPNKVEGGSKINIIAANACLDVDIRSLPGQDEDYVTEHLKKALGDLAGETEIGNLPPEEGGIQSIGTSSPVDSEFVSTMEGVVNELIPGSNFVPFVMPGATDCRFMRERGMDAYGFSLYDPDIPLSQITGLTHGTNERVSLKTVELSLKVYYKLAISWLTS